jgi:hypothetical protein
MFLGTIEPVVRNFLAANAEAFRSQVVAVGCSGNFTSERVLWESTGRDVQLFSNDISLYSSMIGAHLAGQPFDTWVNEPDYAWLNTYLEQGGWTRIAALLVFYRVLMFERQRNAYEKRMWGEYMRQFPDLVAGTREKLDKLGLKIAGYYPGDIFEHFKQMDAEFGDKVIYTSYMPFFKGGYEHLYKRLDAIFGWDRPTYPMLDDEQRVEIAKWCMQRRHVTLLDFPLEGTPPAMVGHTRRNKHVYLYSNALDKTALYRRLHPDQGVRLELLGELDPITPDTDCRVTPIATAIIQPYKALYLARNIDFSTGMYGFAVSLGGKVIGFLEYSYGVSGGMGEDWYLFSDFSVGWKWHKRASKLVTMLALCNEVKRELEVKSLRRRQHVSTTAWTDKPVSMKYRGIFDLVKRDEKRGMLNYRATWSGLTAQETFELWTKKYGKG